jgi:hypothetical protein
MTARRWPARALVAVALLLAPLAAQAGALPPLPAAVQGAFELTLWAPERNAANATFSVMGTYAFHPSDDPEVREPMQGQTVVVVVDGVDATQATTKSDGRFFADLPGLPAGHHRVLARADAAGWPVAQTDPQDVLVILPPLAPTALLGGSGRHTGEVTLRWTAPPGDELRPVDTFVVYRRVAGRVSVVSMVLGSSTQAGDTGAPGVPVEYRVSAANIAGTSDPTSWVSATPALPPPADNLTIAAATVDVCHAGTCQNYGPWEFAIVGGDATPVDLRVHATGWLGNQGHGVDLEPMNGSLADTWNDQFTWHAMPPAPFTMRTAADGGFGLVTPTVRVANVLPSQTCLEETLSVGAHYPGVAVPAGMATTNLTASDAITIYLC